MNISEIFIRRPVATTLLTTGLLLIGLLAYLKLPIAALPQVDYPTIVISTILPGASADTMAATVTAPLERQLGQIPNLDQMTSISSFASSQITLQFNLDRNIDAAEQDVQAAINAASNLLPQTLPTPPTYSKSNPADTPILALSVSGDNIPLSQVDDYADSILAQKISQVSGVGLVTLNGGQKPAVRIQVDPEALAGLGLTLEDLRNAIMLANVNQPKGTLNGARLSYTIATDDQLFKAESYRSLIVAYKNGSPVRLHDVAKVVDGVENSQLAGWANHKRAIILNVQRQPGANVIQVADNVKALLERLRVSLPESIHIDILNDRTETVRASVDDVQYTLLLTIVLVVVIIFVFLRNIVATCIPIITVPMSIFGTFGLMYMMNFSLNNLSLMALTISTGFIVDDAIVMMENISRYIEEGMKPFDAAIKGAKQIGFTVISLTVSLIAVLIPLLFMGGIIGRLFREFALTLSIAIAVSAILSLTLTPMMCAYLLRQDEHIQHGKLYHLSEKYFNAWLRAYETSLNVVMRHPRLTLLSTLATVALTLYLAISIPKGFFPQQDTGLIVGISEAAPDVSFQNMSNKQQKLIDMILEDHDVASVASFIGTDGTNATTNNGRLSISLMPRAMRTSNASAIMQRLQDKFMQHHQQGVDVYLQAVQDLQIDSRLSRTQFQYTMQDASIEELWEWTPKFVAALQALPQLQDVTSDNQAKGLEAQIIVDRDTASRLGVGMQAIDDILYDAFGQRQISTIFTQLNLYRVILEVQSMYQNNPDVLQMLYVNPSNANNATPVQLSAFSHVERHTTPLAINHDGQFPAVTISFNVAPGYALGDAMQAIAQVGPTIGMPNTIRADFQGTALAFQTALASEPVLILAALITVYIVLGVLYESYIHPITILSTLPSAGVGALLALMACRVEFSVIALIGIILLIGIVKKNAIMMIDFALEEERQHHTPAKVAIVQACALRFRPIMMTTMAALLGAIPLAFGQGTGSELRQPLGIAIVGGLIVSQFLTLYTTPVIYLYMDKIGQLFTKRGHTPPT